MGLLAGWRPFRDLGSQGSLRWAWMGCMHMEGERSPERGVQLQQSGALPRGLSDSRRVNTDARVNRQ